MKKGLGKNFILFITTVKALFENCKYFFFSKPLKPGPLNWVGLFFRPKAPLENCFLEYEKKKLKQLYIFKVNSVFHFGWWGGKSLVSPR